MTLKSKKLSMHHLAIAYGDNSDITRVESKIGNPLSPYSTRAVNKHYAQEFTKTCGFKTIGLIYFNILGQCSENSID